MDSLDAVEVVMAFEDEFGKQINLSRSSVVDPFSHHQPPSPPPLSHTNMYEQAVK